jgi:hypothetical protein
MVFVLSVPFLLTFEEQKLPASTETVGSTSSTGTHDRTRRVFQYIYCRVQIAVNL